MTLVFRSPKLVEVISNQNPGPGTYQIKELKQKNNHSSAPFLSKAQRLSAPIEEAEIGPSSYFKEGILMKRKGEGNQSVFKSKIDRFGNNEQRAKQHSKQKEFAKEFNQLMKKQKKQHYYKGKLIDLKLKKEKEEKLCDAQCLPSIPSHQQSFGYRVDYNTNKLVNNYNPKVIFTQVLKKPNEKEDFYFQRSQKSWGKTKKCLINTHEKRAQNQLKHQLSNPNFSAYQADKYFTIEEEAKKAKKMNHSPTSLSKFNQNSPNKKQLLRLNKIKRDFEMYIQHDHIDLEELQKSKNHTKSIEKSPSKKIQKRKPECFLTKEQRFVTNIEESPQKPVIKETIKVKTSKSNDREKVEQKEEEQKEPKKQPFDLGIERFKSRHKESLGPGFYPLKQDNFQHGVNLKQNEQRFKAHSNVDEVPGPGFYDANKDPQIKQKVKYSFSKHRNNAYFNELQSHKAKEHSMQDLYQQVGKHMNYLNKIEKIDSKIRHRQPTFRKLENALNLNNMNQAKKILKQKLELQTEDLKIEKQNNCKALQNKNLKHNHLYVYNKPQQKVSELGPGCYQIGTTLDKKTFNKTVKT